MKVMVTGGAGFIGHHLVGALVERGDQVTVLDDLSTGRISRLHALLDHVDFIEGSILERRHLDRAMAGVEVVFHEAALASVAKSIADPRLTNEVNVTGTVEVMRSASRHGVRRVVFAGSSAVYGTPRTLPCTEEQRPSPTSPYGVSKLAAELYTHVIGGFHGLETVVLRYFNVYGPGQDPASEYAAVIPRFITTVTGGARPTIHGTGGISRDFVYVADVVAANLRAALASTPTGLTCNIATGLETTLVQLLGEISRAAGRAVEPIYGPPREGDIPASVGDIRVAREALGYDVTVSLHDGIAKTVDWYRRNAAPMGESGS
jgi:UDP-glucose 4-epimerase